MATPAPKMSKVDFVASLDPDLSVVEVEEALKGAGYPPTSRDSVFTLRSQAKKKRELLQQRAPEAPTVTQSAAPKSETKPKPATPKPNKSKPKPQLTRTEFVMKFPLDMPAAEVAKKAIAAGYVMTRENVHKLRSFAKAQAAKRAAEMNGSKPHGVAVELPTRKPANGNEPLTPDQWRGLFAECVLQLGYRECEALLESMKEQIANTAYGEYE